MDNSTSGFENPPPSQRPPLTNHPLSSTSRRSTHLAPERLEQTSSSLLTESVTSKSGMLYESLRIPSVPEDTHEPRAYIDQLFYKFGL